jgi:hypothetical protein
VICVMFACTLLVVCWAWLVAGTCISYTPLRSVSSERMLSRCGRGALGITKTSSYCMRMSDDFATCDAASSVSRVPATASQSRVVTVRKVGSVAEPVSVARVTLAFATVTSVRLCAVR